MVNDITTIKVAAEHMQVKERHYEKVRMDFEPVKLFPISWIFHS
jgi:hypothetical protein